MNKQEFLDALERKLCGLPQKEIEGCLNFLEVVNWFKTLKLDKNKHVPFVAKASAMKDVLSIQPTKKESLFVGVFDEEKNEINSLNNDCILILNKTDLNKDIESFDIRKDIPIVQ